MKKWIFIILLVYGALAEFQYSYACTDFKMSAQDGSTLIARSMEFAADLKSNLRTSVRGRQFNEFAPNGKPALSWKAQYGYVFLDALNVDTTIDGMNEAGLSFEYLYLPGETQYQNIPAGHENQAMSYLRLGDWVLSNFKFVDEVRAALANVFIFTQTIPGMGDMIFPLHASIYDATGKGIVVEFVNGKMNVYDNQVGILTNSPTYDWQVINLREYVNLSPWTPSPVVIGSLVFSATGQGSGMKGLPGDSSPASRFSKIAAMKASVYQARNAAEALNLAQHIINNVDIPAGFVRARNKDKTSFETTQWTIFKDLTNKVFYYRTYSDTTLHSVILSQIDFSEAAPRLKMPIADNQVILDITKQFLQSKSL
jgi:choloylglycine hydrolase